MRNVHAAEHTVLGRGAANLGDHGPVRRRRGLLARAHRLHLHGQGTCSPVLLLVLFLQISKHDMLCTMLSIPCLLQKTSYLYITGPEVVRVRALRYYRGLAKHVSASAPALCLSSLTRTRV